MPIYEYRCHSCDQIFEKIHSYNNPPEIICACGSKDVEKLISLVNVNTKTGRTLIQGKAESNHKLQVEKRAELQQDFGVHEVRPLAHPDGTGNNFDKVYDEIKKQGTFVKDKMQYGKYENELKRRKKNKEFHENAMKNQKQRLKEIKEHRAQEAYDDRKIGDVSTKRKK